MCAGGHGIPGLIQAAAAKAGSRPATGTAQSRAPSARASAAPGSAASAAMPSTYLTGPEGVPPSKLNVGRNVLLGQ